MNQQKTVAFYTLGCKLNFAETSTIARQFTEAGYGRVDVDESPDVVVINTCSVTDQADIKCRNIVRRAVRNNQNVFVAVIGCYAQLKPEDIAAIDGVGIVLGANEKFNLITHIESPLHDAAARIVSSEIKDVKEFIPSHSQGDRTRTFLKVQDGCNYFCAFCTIPLARGRSRSADIATTLDEARKAIDAGAKEIVLTGVNIGDFGTSRNERFIDLIRELDRLDGVERYRISSIEPNLLSEEIIDFVGLSRRFMPHFHIPLQSGSDDILRAMRRRYRTELYQRRIEYILKTIPDAAIGVDVITGFPGESDLHFEETRNFLLELPVAYFHVFSYSERDHTTAMRLAGTVPIEQRNLRTRQLRMLSEKKKRAFYLRHKGESRPVLWEAAEDEGLMTGFTDNYIKVVAPWDRSWVNTIRPIQLEGLNSDCMYDFQTESRPSSSMKKIH